MSAYLLTQFCHKFSIPFTLLSQKIEFLLLVAEKQLYIILKIYRIFEDVSADLADRKEFFLMMPNFVNMCQTEK